MYRKREKFEELIFRDYFLNSITKNNNFPKPKISGCLDFISTAKLTKDQLCERDGDSYIRKEVSAMWYAWCLCLENFEII